MCKLFYRYLAWSALLLFPLATLAQTKLEPISSPPTADARRAIAKEWSSLFMTLDHQIPTLSPTQERWLKTEYHNQIADAGNRYTDRALAARDSLEYQIFIVKPRTTEIVKVFSQIASGKVRDRNHEIALWSSAANMFVDYGYWQALKNLVDRGTVQNKIGHVDDFYFENYTLQAQIFLSSIIIPYLENRLP